MSVFLPCELCFLHKSTALINICGSPVCLLPSLIGPTCAWFSPPPTDYIVPVFLPSCSQFCVEPSCQLHSLIYRFFLFIFPGFWPSVCLFYIYIYIFFFYLFTFVSTRAWSPAPALTAELESVCLTHLCFFSETCFWASVALAKKCNSKMRAFVGVLCAAPYSRTQNSLKTVSNLCAQRWLLHTFNKRYIGEIKVLFGVG